MTGLATRLEVEKQRAALACERAHELHAAVEAASAVAADRQVDLRRRLLMARRLRRAAVRSRAARIDQLTLAELHDRYARTRSATLRARLAAEYEANVVSIVRRFTNRGEAAEDLVQVGRAALVAALDRFDPTRGIHFTSFLHHAVSGELKRHFRDKVWPMRVPRGLLERYLECRATSERLSTEWGRPVTPGEVADAVGITQDAVLEAMEVGTTYRLRSLDAARRAGDDETTPSPDPAVHDRGFDRVERDVLRQQMLEPLLRSLDADDARLVAAYYLDGRLQHDLAHEFGISQVTVSRRLSRAITRLRQAAGSQVS